jgi:hypothetical protein
MRTLAMPKAAQPCLLTSLREKLIKIGAKVVSRGRYVTFHMAEVAVSRQIADILSLIARLRAPPAPDGIKCGAITAEGCALMLLAQPGLAVQRSQPTALNASCGRRALLPLLKSFERAILASTRRKSGECRLRISIDATKGLIFSRAKLRA